ncbi:hypothetical protein DVK85_10255 [Flavobacterium arcticum]|uniref:DUF4468 domain-containing protein n=1 Tax=Flavobacterium arcticum TaxID=1784713 RepID=A0A345HDD5_9FLAO|nr:hypothetical protein [Flavobacterium arcticum]AXG74595.1 hypothetical protein DVK85_10255 [Flavobacterium arcticum]KAF2512284.1 hypothetical protein E0W72_03410 [Flavobacterium arcticum]
MKKVIFFFLFSISCFAQVHNFYVKNNSLVWENVIITNQDNIPEFIAHHPRLSIASSNHSYKGKGTEIRHTCEGCSSYMDNELSFDFEIKLREGKYSIIVYNLIYTVMSQENHRKIIIADSIMLKKGGIRNDLNKDLTCLDIYFNRIFSMTGIYKNKL